MKKPLILLALVPFLAASCLERNQEEANPSLSPDVDEVFALADIYSGDPDSTKVVKITSNRSWSAHLNDLDNPIDETDPTQAVPWGYLSVESHPNLSNSTETFPLVVVFRRNFTKNQINGVLNIYSEGKKAASIKLTQAPVKYHLNVTTDVKNVGENGEVVPVKVDCNTAWTVRVDKSTTADLSHMNPGGFDPTVLGVNFLANEEKAQKTAKLIFSAPECEDVAVEFTQDPTTSDLNVFEIFTTISASGTGNKAAPVVLLDRNAMFERYPELAAAKPKFYCTISTEEGVEPDVPTTKSASVPTDGWNVRQSTILPLNYLSVYILGVAEGYRDCYCKVCVRDWKLGKNHTKAGGNGLVFGNESKLSPTADCVSCVQDNYLSCFACEGGHAQLYLLAHNQSYNPVGVINVSGNDVGSFSFDGKYTGTSPGVIVSPLFDCEIGNEIRLTSTEARMFIWDFAVLEMKKVKP